MPKTGSGSSPLTCSADRAALALALLLAGAAAADEAGGLRPFSVEGDAIPAPLTGAPGDAARGRAIVATR